MNFLRWLTLMAAGFVLALPLAAQPSGKDMQITVYSDGVSCPAGCDAHVVFNAADNGTGNAHLPGTANATCVKDSACRICFDAQLTQCMDVMYRREGPAPGRFDFTPAFFDSACARTDIPARLASECATLKANAGQWADRVNCIREPADPKCIDLMTRANQAKAVDEPKYRKCVAMGEASYNASQPDAEKRALDCAYEKTPTGGNPPGKWRKLLPGACLPGTYVGPYGTDCCSGVLLVDFSLGVECSQYYRK
jgi:hypothetical protein